MIHSNRHASDVVSESVVFVDGDILVLILASFPDFNLCLKMIRQELDDRWHDIRTVLVDYSAMEEPQAINHDSYSSMTRFISNLRLRLLVLDAPREVTHLLEALMPDAVLIDSMTAGYFGQDIKARTSRLVEKKIIEC